MAVYEYIKGDLHEVNPTQAVVEQSGIGYNIQVSLHTYSQIREKKQVTLFIQEIIREDVHDLFGFSSKQERELFRQLISVTGIGANIARMMLSSLSPDEIRQAILRDDVNLLKKIKGIGVKTAQRVIIDLRDKMGKMGDSIEFLTSTDNTTRDEALSALTMLGFGKSDTAKVLEKLMKQKSEWGVEELIKAALKLM